MTDTRSSPDSVDIPLKKVQLFICQACLDGIGEECHTPGCALFLHSVDLPIPPELYTVVEPAAAEGATRSCEAVDPDVAAAMYGARSSADSARPWVEGEPSECDGSAWDRLPPLVVAAFKAAQQSVMAAGIGSCDCNTKSPNAAYHTGYCRYLKILSALDSLDIAEKGLRSNGVAQRPIEDVRKTAADSIRTFCQSLGAASVQVSSDGVERIYYAGISLDALSVAVALALTSTKGGAHG